MCGTICHCTGRYEVTSAQNVDCGVLVRPKLGSAVLWPNVDFGDFSRAHPKTNHAALAVHEGCKMPSAKGGGDCFKWAANVPLPSSIARH